MKILVIGGGSSAEREISLRSSKSIYDAMSKLSHKADYLDWDGDTSTIASKCKGYDLVFPVLHGPGGEDGTIQKILEDSNVSYAGTGSEASVVCMSKQKTREVCAQHNIQIPKGEVLTYDDYLKSELYKIPHVIKPVYEGSSVDTFIVEDKSASVKILIEQTFEKYGQMLVEEYIKGIELTVPILEGVELSAIEIVPPADGWFDLENKYNGKSSEFCPPRSVSIEDQKKAINIAKKVHQVLGAKHFSRVDIKFWNKEFYVLELNTIPGMTSESLFPKAVKNSGMSMESFVEYLIKLGKN